MICFAGLFPVCFTVVDSENRDNWEWFLRILGTLLLAKRNVVFMADRNTDLKESLPRVFH